MSLNRFADDSDLSRLLLALLSAYELSDVEKSDRESRNVTRMTTSSMGEAVAISFPVKLTENMADAAEHSYLGDQLVIGLTGSALYFLGRKTPPNKVPHVLKLGMPIRHNNMQSTAILAEFTSFRKAYEKIHKAWMANPEIEEPHKLVYMAIEMEPHIKESREDIYSNMNPHSEVISFFQPNSRVDITHLNSTGDSHFDTRAFNSLNNIRGCVNFIVANCSQQQGNTCGEHMVVNLFALAMLNVIPEIIVLPEVSANSEINTKPDVNANLETYVNNEPRLHVYSEIQSNNKQITSKLLRDLSVLLRENLDQPDVSASAHVFNLLNLLTKASTKALQEKKTTKATAHKPGFWKASKRAEVDCDALDELVTDRGSRRRARSNRAREMEDNRSVKKTGPS